MVGENLWLHVPPLYFFMQFHLPRPNGEGRKKGYQGDLKYSLLIYTKIQSLRDIRSCGVADIIKCLMKKWLLGC